ncbi:hypothetical protein Ddye_018672 [Dipteronia dyeriana]|uniref:Bifunctional inhibitor/plant lipid transfer protein/seed storage helical domain-containing protein n=1 Tax=Dipteronia dyeriana TaxID=168575 RepID=A0AAD9X1X6_9ROSI|nr:hypothetical protein Ddye_018672 [Dipteronia dyeriana]
MPRLVGQQLVLIMLVLISGSAMARQNQQQQQHISNCQDVTDYFPYCLVFLKGYNHRPSQQCCVHIKLLNVIAKGDYKHIHERRRICQCIEDMVKGTSPFIPLRIRALPKYCRMKLGFPISNHRDCSRV